MDNIDALRHVEEALKLAQKELAGTAERWPVARPRILLERAASLIGSIVEIIRLAREEYS